jgi:hypothetical protein
MVPLKRAYATEMRSSLRRVLRGSWTQESKLLVHLSVEATTQNREVVVQEPVPREWIQQYVLLTLANGEEDRVFLQRLVGGGFEVLSRINVPIGEKDAAWAMDIREDRVVTKVYSWHSIQSVRLLQPEEREELQKQWRPGSEPDKEDDST